MEEVKPCKCGNTMCGVAHRNILGETFYYVLCPICGQEGPYAKSEDWAIIFWNNERFLDEE